MARMCGKDYPELNLFQRKVQGTKQCRFHLVDGPDELEHNGLVIAESDDYQELEQVAKQVLEGRYGWFDEFPERGNWYYHPRQMQLDKAVMIRDNQWNGIPF